MDNGRRVTLWPEVMPDTLRLVGLGLLAIGSMFYILARFHHSLDDAMTVLRLLSLGLFLGAFATCASAATTPELVYGDELPARGEVGTEFVAGWSQTSPDSDSGGQPKWQAMGELAYGVTANFSVGIKLPATRADGSWHGHGVLGELKYVAPHGTDGFYWGVEMEAGRLKPIDEERGTVLEAVPLLGYRAGRYHLIANPGLEYSSSGDEKGWSFSPKVKAVYLLNDAHALGLEYHVEAGKFGDFTPRDRRSEIAYGVWDAKIDHHRLSVALGHGATHGSDRWAVRIGVELDD